MRQHQSDKLKPSTITIKDIAWLWVNLTTAFGYKFLKNFGEKDNGVWFEALKDLTREDLEYGFKRAIRLTTTEEREKFESWPPNVKEFRMYCERRLQDFNLPEPHIAFAQAKNNNYTKNQYWSHPLIKLATHQLRKKDSYIHDEDYDLFKKAYNSLCQQFMRGIGLCIQEDTN